jgi:type IX secretion system substrate protein
MLTNFKYVTFIVIIILTYFSDGSSRDKHSLSKIPTSSNNFDEYVIDIGQLQQYVTNSTYTGRGGNDIQTFVIGGEPKSMNWLNGGYFCNNYLYYGFFNIGINHQIVKFNTATSNDFKVIPNNAEEGIPLTISFSMTDELALDKKIGIKCISKIYAWALPIIDDFFIYEYSIINTSGSLLADVYYGFYADCDVSECIGPMVTFNNMDDLVDCYYSNGNNEIISYMWDGDSPYRYGDDTGGQLTPKESLGYIGSRVLTCPPSNHGIPANRQSGHQWWDWNSHPESDSAWYNLMAKEEFKMKPSSPHDYRYFQTMGPWDIPAGDTIVVAIGFGIGVGLEGLRTNLQYAYNLYNSFGKEPKITDFTPKVDTLKLEMGESQQFSVTAKNGDSLIYRWINNDKLFNFDKTYLEFSANKFNLGTNKIVASVSDNQYTSYQKWIVEVVPAKKYELSQNYPNPFNGTTTIPFELQKDGNVNITIYDVLGRKVKTLINKPYTFGKHTISWDGTDANGIEVVSGIYFYSIKTNNFKKYRRLLIIK